MSGCLRGLPEREVSRGRVSCSASRGGCAWWPGSAASGPLLWSAIRLSADRGRFAVFGTCGLERGRFPGRVLTFGLCGVRVDVAAWEVSSLEDSCTGISSWSVCDGSLCSESSVG